MSIEGTPSVALYNSMDITIMIQITLSYNVHSPGGRGCTDNLFYLNSQWQNIMGIK